MRFAARQYFADINEKSDHQCSIVSDIDRDLGAQNGQRALPKQKVGDSDDSPAARCRIAGAQDDYWWHLIQFRPEAKIFPDGQSGGIALARERAMGTDYKNIWFVLFDGSLKFGYR